MSAAVRLLRDVRLADAAEVGGKAASLGELLAAGVRVPNGVVVTARATGLADDERRSLLGAVVADLGVGPFAVRSSGMFEDGAQRSYAGIYESVLDVSADELPAAMDRVLASARDARASGYAAAGEGPAGDGEMAVIVQHLVAPASAGVALTADPINGDRRSCIVTAVRGRGERLVSGAALGDEWVVRGGTATPRRRPEAAINRRQANRVASEARRIAVARGTPQDIEWAIDGDDTLWILQARPMTALPPDVSWDAPARGAYTRALRFGEWIAEPVTPLFESWLLTTMEDSLHAQLKDWIGQRAPRPYHVIVNGWYFYSINWLSGSAMLRSLPGILRQLARAPRRVAGVVPPTVRHSVPIFEREWREDLLPRYRAAVARAEGVVETRPIAELPALIDELADLAGVYFASIAALAGAAYKMEMNLARFYRQHLEPSLGGSHLALVIGFEAPADPGPHAVSSLDWWYAPASHPSTAQAPADHHGRLVEARRVAEAAAFKALAASPRRLRAFRRLLAETQHLVPLREEQVRELTIAWPVMRRAVLRIGEGLAARGGHREAGRRLLPGSRRGARGARRRRAREARRCSRPPFEAGGAGKASAAADGRPCEPDGAVGLGQLSATHWCRSLRPRPCVGRAGVARPGDRARSGDPRPARVRPAPGRRDPRGAVDRARVDAALHPGGRGRDRCRERCIARLDHRS